MYILGLSCFYHESAACLIKDGIVVAASAEERFSRKKHDSDFPELAVAFCLEQAGISKKDIDYIVFYEKPFWKFQRILQSCLATYPFSSQLFAKAMVNWLTDKLWVRSILAGKLGVDGNKILFIPHHISHAAASFYPSGFEKSAILTFDGVGEWTTTTYGIGEGNTIRILKQIKFPHSIGLLYSTFTAFLGFEVNDGEYKVMGMAPYGKPRYTDTVKKLITLYKDGSYSLNMEYFTYHKSSTKSFSKKFEELFGQPRTKDVHFFTEMSGYPSYFGEKPDNYNELCKENQRYADIAASIQAVTEDILVLSANKIFKETRCDSLCIGGGVGLNSVANGRILRESSFKRVFIQPAAGDDGGALGAALYAYHGLLDKKRIFTQTHCYLGKDFKDSEIEQFLTAKKIQYKKWISEEKLIEELASALAKDKVIGFFHGRAEWGPRALGARSILASPRKEKMKEIVNTKIKFREPYRPFAPVTLAEKVSEYFSVGDKEHHHLTNFMLGVFPVKKSKRKIIPAITHVDGTGRVQIVSKKQNTRYYNLIKKFGDKTGVYVLMNTSFNLKGEPIVNSPQDAFNTFKKSGLDLLVLEKYIIRKEDI